MPHHSHSDASRRLLSSFRLWYIHVFGIRSTCPYVTVSLFNCLVEAMSSYSLIPFPSFSREIAYRPGPFLRLFITFLTELCRFAARAPVKELGRRHLSRVGQASHDMQVMHDGTATHGKEVFPHTALASPPSLPSP